jgi:hypothetical protein
VVQYEFSNKSDAVLCRGCAFMTTRGVDTFPSIEEADEAAWKNFFFEMRKEEKPWMKKQATYISLSPPMKIDETSVSSRSWWANDDPEVFPLLPLDYARAQAHQRKVAQLKSLLHELGIRIATQ